MSSNDVSTPISERTRMSDALSSLRNSRDIILVVSVAMLLPIFSSLPVPLIRVVLGIVAVLFIPGYALVAAMFPRRDELTSTEKLGLGLGISIALIPVFTLILSALPAGITPRSVSVSVLVWVVITSSIALVRRAQFSPPTDANRTVMDPSRGRSGIRSVAGLKLLPAVVGVGAFLFLAVQHVPLVDVETAKPLEFYALGPAGLVADYPVDVSVEESASVIVGIVHPYSHRGNYVIEVWLYGEADEELVSRTPVTAMSAGPVETTVSWRMNHPGENQQVTLRLLSLDEGEPLRELTLWINVRQ